MIGWYDVGIPLDVATEIRGGTPATKKERE